ncbi:MAG: galactose-1-phosphate uridylyltransferase [Actinobacteria bacterium]|nr:galactose-1-phosphate uridylyltransferase [Actinomycetota bacterium]
MSTLRQDPTTRAWTIVAPRRAARPHFAVIVRAPDQPEHDPNCPFCPGNESMTPPEVHRISNGAGWHVRVVGNLYPALGGDGAADGNGSGLFRERPGVGAHEVIIESPRHNARLDEMPVEDVGAVLLAWRQRYRDLESRKQTGAVVVFKNAGPMAGTSLNHPHSQVVATPVIPPEVQRRFEVAKDYFENTGRRLYDDLIRSERTAGERVVEERGTFVAFVPFAAPGPFETWIAPTAPQPSFAQLRDVDVPDLAWLLRRTLRAVRLTNDDPDFNVLVASAPAGEQAGRWFSWHIKVLPRLTTAAGFELGSGMSINPVPPETAASEMREVLREDAPA